MTLFFYSLILLFLFIYSYSQIDLNLTLFSNTYYQSFQNQLINLGYFKRGVSVLVYLLIIFFLYGLYLFFWRQAATRSFSQKRIIVAILMTFVLLASYPAFSHDIFNYLFDARIFTKYQGNPYFFTALDFPSDPWVRFMHWTHRSYPYGPIWLLLTIPFSFFGAGKFVFTLVLFKLMFGLFHLGNIICINKIIGKFFPTRVNLALVYYGLNPLVIIESLVSPHNEVVMLFFLLLSFYFVFIKRKIGSCILSWLLSVGCKFVTVILLPIILVIIFKKRVDFEKTIYYALILIVITLVFLIIQREIYPWYLITLIGLSSLLKKSVWLKKFITAVSMGALLRYAPFLYFGEYKQDVFMWQNVVFIIPLAGLVILFFISKVARNINAIINHSR